MQIKCFKYYDQRINIFDTPVKQQEYLDGTFKNFLRKTRCSSAKNENYR